MDFYQNPSKIAVLQRFSKSAFDETWSQVPKNVQ